MGYTALMHAASGGHDELVRILLAAGADTTLRNAVSRWLGKNSWGFVNYRTGRQRFR